MEIGLFHIVEPDSGLRNLLRTAIEARGFSVATFSTPEAYLDYFYSPDFSKPVAILSACLMPGLNCFDLAKIVRGHLPEQKLAIISSSIPDSKENDLATYAFYRLRKPFRIEALFSLLEAFYQCSRECRRCNELRAEAQCRYGLEQSCPYYFESAHCQSQIA